MTAKTTNDHRILWTIPQWAMHRARVSRQSVYNWIDEGRLTCIDINGKRYITPADEQAFFERNRVVVRPGGRKPSVERDKRRKAA